MIARNEREGFQMDLRKAEQRKVKPGAAWMRDAA
jgi:hypothetical protein